MSDKDERSCQKSRLGHQAKNSLTNPSKGKQKRVSSNISKENESLMKRYGIIPSKVQLKKVNKSSKSVPSLDKFQTKKIDESNRPEPSSDKSQSTKAIESSRQGHSSNESQAKLGIVEYSTRLPESARVKTNICKNVVGAKETVQNHQSSFVKDPIDNDSDIEIVEKPIELIVLDDSPEHIPTNPKKTEKCPQERNKALDAELLKQFGMKDLTVTLSKNITQFSQKGQPEMKKKGMSFTHAKRKIEFETVTPKIDDLTSEEIENLLKQCGMGISVPVIPNDKVSLIVPDKKDVIRSHSPQPSTSKGHGHLKRKKTARKSTKDAVLMEKYSLKESSVLLKNLSRIELAMLRNPHSRFGKSDWLKHKFDSDTESDVEWDIPTPPLTEEFEEAPNSGKNNKEYTKNPAAHSAYPNKSREGHSKDDVLLRMYGIPGSVVVIDSPKKINAVSFNSKSEALFAESKKEKHQTCHNANDKDLIKKFGLPSAIVLIDSPLKDDISACSSHLDVGGTKCFQERNEDKNCGKRKHINDYSERPHKKLKCIANLSSISVNKRHNKKSEAKITNSIMTDRLSETGKKLVVKTGESLYDSVTTNSQKSNWKNKQAKQCTVLDKLRAKSVLKAKESGQRRSRMVYVQTNKKMQADRSGPKRLKRKLDTKGRKIPLKKSCWNVEKTEKKVDQLKHRGPASVKARKQNTKTTFCNNEMNCSKYLPENNISNRYKHLLKDFPQVKVTIPCLTPKDIRKFALDPIKAAKIDDNVLSSNSLCAESSTMIKAIIEQLLDQVFSYTLDSVQDLQSQKSNDVQDVEVFKIDSHIIIAEVYDDPEKSRNSPILEKEKNTESIHPGTVKNERELANADSEWKIKKCDDNIDTENLCNRNTMLKENELLGSDPVTDLSKNVDQMKELILLRDDLPTFQ